MFELGRTRHGYMIYTPTDIYVGASIKSYGEYSAAEQDALASLCKRGQTVVDVGANIGAHTLAFARAVGKTGKVFAYEPQRILYQCLCGTMALNNIRNVYAKQCCVDSTPGEAEIVAPDYEKFDNYGGIGRNTRLVGSTEKVPCVRLDDEGLHEVALVKIDVEGSELRALIGAKQLIERDKPILYVENDRVDESSRLMSYLRVLGYSLYWHIPPLYSADNFLGNAENIWPVGTVSCNVLAVPDASYPVSSVFIPATENIDAHPFAHPFDGDLVKFRRAHE